MAPLGDRVGGLRDGSTARLHNEDDDVHDKMSVLLRQQLCVSAGESPPCFDFDRALRGACGGRVQPDTVLPHSGSRKQFKGWRAGKLQAAAVEQCSVKTLEVTANFDPIPSNANSRDITPDHSCIGPNTRILRRDLKKALLIKPPSVRGTNEWRCPEQSFDR